MSKDADNNNTDNNSTGNDCGNRQALVELIERARKNRDMDLLIQVLPYAQTLGLDGRYWKESNIIYLPPRDSNIGNPTLPALHGGVIGGFMEMAASVHLLMTMKAIKAPKVIDFSIDFVRPGRLVDTYAACNVVRQGKKLANVSILTWQGDKNQPIATARAHFLVD